MWKHKKNKTHMKRQKRRVARTPFFNEASSQVKPGKIRNF